MAAPSGKDRPSLYRRIADDIRAAIDAGEYRAGDSLPSERELVERYGASRGTVKQAFAALRADGAISSRRGARRVVQGGPRIQDFAALVSFSRWAATLGESPSGRVVGLDRRSASEAETDRLALDEGAAVYQLTRVRLLGGEAVMVERTVYPERIGALVADMDLGRVSITERLLELGVVFADAEHTIDAVRAGAEDARLLGVRPGAPLLRERRRTVDPAGSPLEWSDDRYRGDQVAFTVRNSADRNTLSRWRSGSV